MASNQNQSYRGSSSTGPSSPSSPSSPTSRPYVTFDAYRMNYFHAPSRCEKCDTEVGDYQAREAHIRQTGHCADCYYCHAYVPPGNLSIHLFTEHINQDWDEQQAAWIDRNAFEDVTEWCKAKHEGREREWLEKDERKRERYRKYLPQV
ncbi:MAG: hypothetical protein MMC23_005265 [Stictis urceolatum]|nr:hypothetical protein [Stictis urceolata]